MKIFAKYYSLIILSIALLAGGFFRLYKIDQIPQGVYVDEAALGYNAFSILQTGKDEFGKSFPVMFRSFATFQSPVYTYLTVPFVHFLGLNALSTRLPSAIFGTLTIIVLFFLVKVISPDRYKDRLPVFSAVLLAVSPWHIQYSRTAYETNISLFFLLLGSLFFFQALKKPWLFILSALTFAVSFNAYRAETLVVPILVMVLGLTSLKVFTSKIKLFLPPVVLGILIGAVLIFPMISIIRTPGFQARTSELNIFSFNRQLPWGYSRGTDIPSQLLNLKPFLAVREFASLYSSYFSPRYMFSLGDSGPRKPLPDLGTFYIWQFPLYLAGIYFLIKEKGSKLFSIYVFTLLLISPIPAALTRDPYSTLRSLSMVIPQILLISFGLVKILELSWGKINRFKYLIVCALILLSSVKLFISIFYHHDYFRSQYWNHGWGEVVGSFKTLNPSLPIVIDNSGGDSYILALFYLGYDPATYQRDNFEVPLEEYYSNMKRSEVKNLGNITVKKFQWGIDTENIEQYIVADSIAISDVQIAYHKLSIIKEVKYPDGRVALRILKSNPIKK